MVAESRPHPGFDTRLWAILAAGVLVAGVLAAVTRGEAYDMESYRLVRDALDHAPLHVYTDFEARGIIRWPYPPGFFPLIDLAGRLDGLASFDFLIRVPSILATAAIAWLVQDFLGRRGADPRTRLAAAALVSLGPAFLLTAGVHGQFDAVAILPGVAAVAVWERMDGPARAVVAGVLLGAGGAVKTYPLLLVLALLPSVRSRREAGVLLAATAAPLLVAFAPFALEGTLPERKIFEYRGLPGVGGLSLLVQPNVATGVLGMGAVPLNPLSTFLVEHGGVVVAAALLAVAAVGARSRAGALEMSVLLWLAVYAFGVNFFFQYLVWGLPFFLMAGYLREVAVAQLWLLGPAAVYYLRPWDETLVATAYTAAMLAAYAGVVYALVMVARRLWRRGGPAQSSAGGAGPRRT